MKLNICILVAAGLTSLSSARAQLFPPPNFSIGIAVTEKGENLTVTWDDGTALDGVQIDRLDTKEEAWHISLPFGFFLAPGTYIVGEPAGEDGVNIVTVDAGLIPLDDESPIPASGFTWVSDVSLEETADVKTLTADNPLTVPFAGVAIPGIPFSMTLSDVPETAPDSGSTFSLAGIALIGLGVFRARWQR